ncbi:MAG TPA: tetratricopeptide repeat protein, partial [Burkholderiales bacterium]|nr:tetratricopeptide repeat protein [Burkholderiales bacterium]
MAQAENLYRLLLESDPRDANARHLLGLAAFDRKDFDGAERSIREALDLAPDTPDFLNSLASVLSETARPAEAADALRRALQVAPDHELAGSNLLFLLNLLPGVDGQSMLAEHRRWARLHLPATAPLFRPENHLPKARPLRVGYLSGDLRAHPVGRILAEVLPRHDRTRFHVTCYSNRESNDAVAAAIRSGVGAWRDIQTLSDAEAADLIVRDGIDILVDLSGHTRGNRLRVLAARPAPVVATWLGYLNTVGADHADWRITSPLADPPAAATWHSERLWYLDDGLWPWRLAEDGSYPQPGAPPHAARGAVTFGSFNGFRKINPEVLSAWAAVLKAVPGSRMRIHGVPTGESVERVCDAFEAEGVPAERLDLFGKLPYEQYLAAYAQVDVMLDTFPYSGGATACEALWMGVPVVALAGAGGFARTSACLLLSLGLDELVAQDARQYLDKAVALAGDLERLSRYRAQLRHRIARAPASDPERFVRGLERAYEGMWKD